RKPEGSMGLGLARTGVGVATGRNARLADRRTNLGEHHRQPSFDTIRLVAGVGYQAWYVTWAQNDYWGLSKGA
ncbi:MAG: hypothetical protein ACM3VX_06955, partial [Bacteroidota bacterium]